MERVDPALLARAETAQGDVPLHQRLRELLAERGLTMHQMEVEAGTARRIFYPVGDKRKPTRATLMAYAYYFGITVEELVEGTNVANVWYRLWED